MHLQHLDNKIRTVREREAVEQEMSSVHPLHPSSPLWSHSWISPTLLSNLLILTLQELHLVIFVMS